MDINYNIGSKRIASRSFSGEIRIYMFFIKKIYKKRTLSVLRHLQGHLTVRVLVYLRLSGNSRWEEF